MFLYFAIEELIPISFFGIVTFIVQFLYEPDQLPSKMAVIFFTFLIVFWASTFEAIWKKKEVEFQTIFGLEELEQAEIELVGFIGKPKRSIATDKINELQYSSASAWVRFGFGLAMVCVFIVIELIIIIYLQLLVYDFEQSGSLPQIQFLEMEVFIPALIWVVIGMCLDQIFRPFAFKFTKWENHKYLSQFEASFIIKSRNFFNDRPIFLDSEQIGIPFRNCFRQ